MKILFTLIPAFNPNEGGVQRTTWKLGKYFTEQGLDVYYYSMANEGHVDSEYGILHHAPERGGDENVINVKDLQSILCNLKPDVVINQMPYYKELRECLYKNKEGLGYLLLGCLRNSLFNFKSNVRDRMRQMLPGPLLTIVDNPLGEFIVQKRHFYRHRKDLRSILHEHDYFILLAPPNKTELDYFVGNYKNEKVLSIPNSIPAVYPEALEKKEKIILHVGRLNVQQKRSDLLLPFWEKVYEQLPDWRFIIVGDGEYMPELKAALKNKPLPRIELAGYQKPEEYYERASIFMMPSAYEGFPNTIIEAQSYGCVPLAFNSYAALNWIVNDGQDAKLSPPYDIEHMGRGVLDLAEGKLQDWQYRSIENAGRFTIDRVGKIWLNFFKKHELI